jgi:hypothetical protein
MKFLTRGWVVLTFLVAADASAELQQLDDNYLSSIDGQSGLSVDMDIGMSIGEVAYFDDGNSLQLQGIKLGAAADINNRAHMEFDIDIESDGGLLIGYDIQPTRFYISDIKLDDNVVNGFGGFGWDFAITGTTKLHSNGLTNASEGVVFDTSYSLTDGRFIYHTNGNEIFFDDISMNVEAPGVIWEPSSTGPGVSFRVPSYKGTFNIGGIRFASGADSTIVNYDKATASSLPSFGSLRGDFDMSANYEIQGGGRYGASGIRIDSQHTINSMNLIYSDDGNDLAFKDISGWYNVDDMRIDVANDSFGDKALAVTVSQITGAFDIGRIEAGAAGKSFGGVGIDFDFSDQVVDGVTYSNKYFVKAGGNAAAGRQGMTIDTMWSLADANVSYTDNGNSVIFSGLSSYGHGTVTVDVTSAGFQGGEEFFDGLRIGFEDFKGSYKIDGLKVGDDSKPLQGGTELLLALGVYPAYDFNLNGQVTLGAGGRSGEGITINSDIVISEGNAALMIDENGKGLWVTGLNYDIHLRDMTVDMTAEGIEIVKGEAWSTMDIGDLRIGDKNSSGSFGRFVLQRYETGSSMVIKPGGAGDVCVGGTGSSSGACSSSGGVWEQRGDEGITVSLKQIFAEAVDDVKRNRFMWETNRVNGNNDTGTQLIFDNITTNDGDGVNNTYGFRNDISIDVYQTKVVKKTNGADSRGVVGNKGDEKILDGSRPEGYRYVSSPTAADMANRPVGFAVQAHTHFKELSIDNVQFKHANLQEGAVGIHGFSLQNVSINSNLTATPID